MANFTIDYSKIVWQENIPHTSQERIEIERNFKHLKPQSLYLSLIVGLGLPALYAAISEPVDFISLLIWALLIFACAYFICWLVYQPVFKKLKKDIEAGKSVVETAVLTADYSNDGDSMFIPGKVDGTGIILSLFLVDASCRYFNPGDQVIVEFLVHSKMAISISKADIRPQPNPNS